MLNVYLYIIIKKFKSQKYNSFEGFVCEIATKIENLICQNVIIDNLRVMDYHNNQVKRLRKRLKI